MNDVPFPDPNHSSRREFIRSSSLAALGTVLVAPHIAVGQDNKINSETLKIGLIGCGGRGTGAANQALNSEKNVALTAMGDIFEDQLQASLQTLQKEAPDKVAVKPENCFTGFDAFEKVLKSGVDVVILATPPGFRPQHLTAAINAGKHVFCEKPMAVDGPGVRMVMAAAQKAKEKNLAIVAGFCWRYHEPKRAIFSKILEGDIGNIETIYSTYNTGPVKDVTIRKPGWSEMMVQLRNWYQFAWLSGDHIAEQAVHSIDMMSWAMGDLPPARAVGTGGRQVRTSYGNIYDHFAIVYEYENGTRGFHFCRQQLGCSNDYSVNLAGTKGRAQIDCSRNIHTITGEKAWRFPKKEVTDMYQVEHNELFASIRAGKPINDGPRMATSTLLAIMGRMAAYTGTTVTWDQALNSQEVLAPPQLSFDAPLTLPPVPMPGKTKFA